MSVLRIWENGEYTELIGDPVLGTIGGVEELSGPMISIIVPVYNTELFLHKCLDSIFAQSFSDWELILINDGSNDQSPQICEEYCARDSRVQYLSKSNSGVSDTRNKGLEKAKGTYVTFVDSDDYLETDYLKKLFGASQEGNIEIVGGGLTLEYPDGERKQIKLTHSKVEYMSGKDALCFACDMTRPVVGFAAGRLISRLVIENNHIRFDKNITMNEDSLFDYQCYIKSGRIAVIEDCNYIYRIHGESATEKAQLNPEHYRTKLLAFKRIREIAENELPQTKFEKNVNREYYVSTINYLNYCFANGSIPDDIDYLIKEAKEANNIAGNGWKYSKADLEMLLLKISPKLAYHAYRRIK